ncbi:hypothetical protein ANCCEY_09047 [Ancylostoma ceylanicum]|uniref:Uncharacterized protein n=1 Tax=Ancylostoma ceylanicum TaxID=53326 RepID=A0A0D6LPB7_9BILA|nr:hypothetical protein ANCCEY_09047 [Ancylostoma ceylanicum]
MPVARQSQTTSDSQYSHLDQYIDEKELVEEIKRNLYVDNLLLTANTRQETSHFYQRTKCMFQDLNMNLREFTSNDQDLIQFIAAHDSWIRSKPHKGTGIFVFNRSFEVSRIAEHLSVLKCVMKFGHITSEHKPADCGTRGLNKRDLQEHLWWQGPSFLRLREEDWPMSGRFFSIDDQEINNPIVSILPEFSSEVFHVAPSHENREDQMLLRPGQVRTFTKAKRVIAQVILLH